MATGKKTFGLFEVYGPELEYMLVHPSSLEPAAVSEAVLHRLGADKEWQVQLGAYSACNEFVQHVIEINAANPAPSLVKLHQAIAVPMKAIAEAARQSGARLLPTGMHPWMSGDKALFWKRHHQDIYGVYRRLFNPRADGFCNVQSAQLNLPYNSQESFYRLHTALRLILPILPALAASTPYRLGRHQGLMDERLRAYRTNQLAIPQATGGVIPEAYKTIQEYKKAVIGPISKALKKHAAASLDPQWVNSRGVIPRFDRQAQELRTLDLQECPGADFAIMALIVEILKMLCSEKFSLVSDQAAYSTQKLKGLEIQAEVQADQLKLDQSYLSIFNVRVNKSISAAELWQELAGRSSLKELQPFKAWLKPILKEGPLSRRMLKKAGKNPSRVQMVDLYRSLADCLQADQAFC